MKSEGKKVKKYKGIKVRDSFTLVLLHSFTAL